MTKSKKTKIIIISGVVAAVLVLSLVLAALYLGDYYRAADGAIASFDPEEGITVTENADGSLVFSPENPIAGFIFYPGGKVEHNAYQQLMAELARDGVLTVLVKMPFNLAVLDVNAADGIKESYPEIDSWYIGGHSLGGSMAASYLEAHSEEFDGLVLLAAYSTVDLSATDLEVLSVYGSEDLVLDLERYDECCANLPGGFTEAVITGGNHAYFGIYGEQEGDGEADIPNSVQIRVTARRIMELIEE